MNKELKLLKIRSEIIDQIFKNRWEEVWFFPEYKGVKGFLGTDPIIFISINPSFGAFPSNADKFYYKNLKKQGFSNAHLTDFFKIKKRNQNASDLLNNVKYVKEAEKILKKEFGIVKPKLVVCVGKSYESFYRNHLSKLGCPNIKVIPHYAPQFNDAEKEKKFKSAMCEIRNEFQDIRKSI